MAFMQILLAFVIYLVPLAIALFLFYWVVRKAIRDELGTRVDSPPRYGGSAAGES